MARERNSMDASVQKNKRVTVEGKEKKEERESKNKGSEQITLTRTSLFSRHLFLSWPLSSLLIH
jgi:hypothetical protein